MAQIEIKNLTFAYPEMKTPVLKDISLEIEEGEFVVICGESGCGKSTLLRNLKPAIRPYGKVSGEILYNGNLLEKVEKRIQAEEIGFIMQNPEHQIVMDKVWHELAFGLENLGYKTEDIRLRVVEMAEYFGITDWYFKDTDKLSGGQKQLLNLAAVMTMYPKVMILDEPTAQLDPIAAENFIEILKKINKDLGITVIIIEHRLELVMCEADKLIVLKEGQIYKKGSPRKVADELTDEQLVKLMPISVQLYKGFGEGREIPLSISQGRKWINSIEIEKKNDDKKVNRYKQDKKDRVICCRNLWFRYEKNGEDIVKGLNLDVNKGEIFAVLGGNGTGKSTTMSLLSGVNKPYRGKIRINGRISALPQNVQTLFRKETVEEELEGVSEEVIEFTNLQKNMKHHPYDLSGGQQQKLALAKVLAMNPDILILDEPTNGLDAIYKENLMEMLRQLKKSGKTIIIVSHDIDFCGEIADRCGMFAYGNIIAENDCRDFFANNRFYTTSVSKMVGHRIAKAVKKEDVTCYLVRKSTI